MGRGRAAARGDDARADRGPASAAAGDPHTSIARSTARSRARAACSPICCHAVTADAPPPFDTTDEEGVEHRMWPIPGDEPVGSWLAEEHLLIADGHHRYATALEYRERASRCRWPGPLGPDPDAGRRRRHRGRARPAVPPRTGERPAAGGRRARLRPRVVAPRPGRHRPPIRHGSPSRHLRGVPASTRWKGSRRRSKPCTTSSSTGSRPATRSPSRMRPRTRTRWCATETAVAAYFLPSTTPIGSARSSNGVSASRGSPRSSGPSPGPGWCSCRSSG